MIYSFLVVSICSSYTKLWYFDSFYPFKSTFLVGSGYFKNLRFNVYMCYGGRKLPLFIVNKVLFLRKPDVINCSPSPILHCLILWGKKLTIEILVDIDIILNWYIMFNLFLSILENVSFVVWLYFMISKQKCYFFHKDILTTQRLVCLSNTIEFIWAL